MIEQFHFLRPWWLLALPALAWLIWLLRQRGPDSGNWSAVVDPVLLPHLLSADIGTGGKLLFRLLSMVAALAIVALAGPAWEKHSQATYEQPAALVVALDLSRSMDATDIRPSRLARARHKIADILNARKEGQTALVVYAADAFAVTPLTTDVETILALLPDLETGLMPAQGSRADRAFERALELFSNSAVDRGDLLLVSDGFNNGEIGRLENLIDEHDGHRVSILAIGTAEGGPIPVKNGGFLKDRAGDIVIAAMNVDGMRSIAEHGGGVYTPISTDDADISTLARLMESSADEREAQLSERSAEQWRELGPSLILLLLPLAALAFRRGLVWMLPLVFVLLPPEARALDWQGLWQNDDQRALQLFEQGEHEVAAKMFVDENWRASASYRAGDFATAADQWQALDSEAAGYNHANALARQGRYQEAVAAYDQLLTRNPSHADALHNRKAIADWLEQQQSAQDQSGEQADEDQQSQQSSDENSGSQDGGNQAQAGDDRGDNAEQSGQDGESQSRESRNSQQQQDDQSGQQQQDGQSGQAEQAGEPQPGESGATMADLDQQMSEQAAEQWLRKIPDDPGGLLRRKFVYQYRRRGGVEAQEQEW